MEGKVPFGATSPSRIQKCFGWIGRCQVRTRACCSVLARDCTSREIAVPHGPLCKVVSRKPRWDAFCVIRGYGLLRNAVARYMSRAIRVRPGNASSRTPSAASLWACSLPDRTQSLPVPKVRGSCSLPFLRVSSHLLDRMYEPTTTGELNNPLTTILGSVQRMIQDAERRVRPESRQGPREPAASSRVSPIQRKGRI